MARRCTPHRGGDGNPFATYELKAMMISTLDGHMPEHNETDLVAHVDDTMQVVDGPDDATTVDQLQ